MGIHIFPFNITLKSRFYRASQHKIRYGYECNVKLYVLSVMM